MSNIKTEVMKITPEMASSLLQTMDKNRRIRKTKVALFVEQMRKGQWICNGDTIKISDKDTLIDGQHRLQACIESGVTIESLVVKGIPLKAFITFDAGTVRTMGDALYMEDVPNTNVIASALAIVWMYDQGYRNQFEGGQLYGKISKTDLLKFYKASRESDWTYSANIASSCRRLLAPSVGTACHYLFQRSSRSQADYFFHKLASGEGLYDGDPLLALRRRLENNAISPARLRKGELTKLVIKTWNYVLENEQVKTVSVRGNFPDVIPFIMIRNSNEVRH